MILFNDRIVIPRSLQPEIMSRIHSGHQGRVRCKALARQGVYWRNINSDIDNMVQNCEPCLSTRKSPDKIELQPHTVPTRPFEKIGADIFSIYGEKFHLVVDYFSKWGKYANNPETLVLPI